MPWLSRDLPTTHCTYTVHMYTASTYTDPLNIYYKTPYLLYVAINKAFEPNLALDQGTCDPVLYLDSTKLALINFKKKNLPGLTGFVLSLVCVCWVRWVATKKARLSNGHLATSKDLCSLVPEPRRSPIIWAYQWIESCASYLLIVSWSCR